MARRENSEPPAVMRGRDAGVSGMLQRDVDATGHAGGATARGRSIGGAGVDAGRGAGKERRTERTRGMVQELRTVQHAIRDLVRSLTARWPTTASQRRLRPCSRSTSGHSSAKPGGCVVDTRGRFLTLPDAGHAGGPRARGQDPVRAAIAAVRHDGRVCNRRPALGLLAECVDGPRCCSTDALQTFARGSTGRWGLAVCLRSALSAFTMVRAVSDVPAPNAQATSLDSANASLRRSS